MPGKGKNKKAKKGPTGHEAGSFYQKLVRSLEGKSNAITVAILLGILALGVYLRVLPALNYKLELDANDPWIAYWISKYFVDHGLFDFKGLKDVKQFWYPYGRDFLKSERIGVSWLAAATYPIGKAFGLTLREWLALFPVFAGAAAILMAFLLSYKLTGSRLAGLISAFSMAVAPAAIVRTTVGFVEKIGFSVPFLALMYYLLYESYSSSGRRRLAYSIASGVVGGLIGWIWGGVHLAVVLLAAIIAVDPLLGAPSYERLVRIHLPASLAFIIVSASYPAVGLKYFTSNVGLLIPGAILLYLLALSVYRRLGFYRASLHIWLLAVVIVAGIVALDTGLVSVPNRIAAALGKHVLSPLATSVQEHQPSTFRSLLREAGFPLFLTLMGIVYDFYLIARDRALNERRLFRLTLYLITLFMVYASLRMSYYTQLAGFYTALTSGFIAGVLLGERDAGIRAKKRGKQARPPSDRGADPVAIVGAIFIIMIAIAGGLAHASASYTQNKYRAPAIMTSMLPLLVFSGPGGTSNILVPLNDAWRDALKWIKDNTPEDALIVSWWDYGYWITVNTGRATVADGATLNESQIRLLALILTGTEDQASALLPMLGAKPNKTYIVVYDAFHVVKDERGFAFILPMFSITQSPVNPQEYFITHGRGDLPKSYQMLRISWRVDPFNSTPFTTNYSSVFTDPSGKVYYHFPGFIGSPQENVERVRNTLIYKMMLYGIKNIAFKGVPGPHCQGLLNNTLLVVPTVYAAQGRGALPVDVSGFGRFSLEAVVYDCIEGSIEESSEATRAAIVAVFIYKWLG